MKVKIPPPVYDDLEKEMDCVITVPEIQRRWKKSRKAIITQINTRGLVAVQCGKIYLVHVDSVCMLWGEPQEGK